MTDDLLKTMDTATEPAMDREALGRAAYAAADGYQKTLGKSLSIDWADLDEANRESHRVAGCAASTEVYRSLLARGWIRDRSTQ